MSSLITISFQVPSAYNKKMELDEMKDVACKLFMEWYADEHLHESKIEKQLNAALVPIISNIDNISRQLCDTNNRLNLSNNQIIDASKDLCGLTKSSVKGKVFEHNIEMIFKEMFQNYNYTNTSSVPHSGDAIIESPSGLRIVLEAKHYNQPVPTSQIIKLKTDMKTTGIKYALMMSTNSSIQTKNTIDYELFTFEGNQYCIVFVSYVFDQTHKISSGMLLIEHFHKMNNCTANNISSAINSDLSELSKILDKMSELKQNFLTMERSVIDSIGLFYTSLRDTESALKQQLAVVWDNIGKKFTHYTPKTDEIINKIKKPTTRSMLSKICDMLEKKYDVYLSDNEHNEIFLISNKTKNAICVIKVISNRIDMNFSEIGIKISINESNFCTCKEIVCVAMDDNVYHNFL